MNTLTTAGKVIFSLSYIYFGLNHFINASTIAPGVPAFVPGGILWVYVTGIIMFAGGTLILIDKYARTAAISIGILMLIFVFTVHFPGIFNPEQRSFALGFFFNNLALAGASFFIAGVLTDKKKLVLK